MLRELAPGATRTAGGIIRLGRIRPFTRYALANTLKSVTYSDTADYSGSGLPAVRGPPQIISAGLRRVADAQEPLPAWEFTAPRTPSADYRGAKSEGP
jgi:hypothetical protein